MLRLTSRAARQYSDICTALDLTALKLQHITDCSDLCICPRLLHGLCGHERVQWHLYMATPVRSAKHDTYAGRTSAQIY